MVQLPEPLAETSEAYRVGFRTICDIGRERIRRAGRKSSVKRERQSLILAFACFGSRRNRSSPLARWTGCFSIRLMKSALVKQALRLCSESLMSVVSGAFYNDAASQRSLTKTSYSAAIVSLSSAKDGMPSANV